MRRSPPPGGPSTNPRRGYVAHENASGVAPPAGVSAFPANEPIIGRPALLVVSSGFVLAALLVTSQFNYLLFHALAEMFSIAVAWAVFMLVWNARRYMNNDALVLLGTAYLFIGLIDLLHTLAYKGMDVFPGPPDANLATQLWIAARGVESISLLAFAWGIGKRIRLPGLFWLYFVATLALCGSILVWPIFPDCYVSGMGLTPFKKGSEYAFILVLGASLCILAKKRPGMQRSIFRLMAGAILLTMAGELAFTVYIDVYGFSNLAGHVAKMGSFFLVYLALIQSGLTRPYQILSERLQASEKMFATAFYRSPILMTISRLDDGTYIEVNDTFSKVTGYPPDECIGRTSTEIGFIDATARRRLKETILSSGLVDGIELDLCKKDGTPMRSLYWGEVINTAGQERLLSIAVDRTDQKRIQDLLKVRLMLSEYADSHSMEELLRQTVDEVEKITDSRIGFFHFCDANQQIVSPSIYSTHTLDLNCGITNDSQHRPLDQTGVWADCIRREQPVIHNDYASLSHRMGVPDGHIRISRLLVLPVFHDDQIVAVMGLGNKPSDYCRSDVNMASELANMSWDIVVRKKTQDDLFVSERQLQNLVANLPGMVFRCRNDADWTMSYISEGCLALTGYKPQDLIDNDRLDFNDLIHPDDRQRVWDTIQEGLSRNNRYELEYRIVNQQGQEKWVWERGHTVEKRWDGEEILEGFISDISDRKAYEREIQTQALVLGQIQDCVTLTDLSGRITYVNQSLLDTFGYSQEEVIGQTPDIFAGKAVGDSFQTEVLERTIADGTWCGEVNDRAKDGRQLIMDLRTQVISDLEGRPIALCGISTDITERRSYELEMRRLAMVIDQLVEAVVITDAGGTILFVNPAFERITGYRREEIVGQTPRILKSGRQDAAFYQELWATITAGHVWRGRLINRRKDGSLYTEKAAISPVTDKGGKITNFVAIKQDVTDELEMEEKLNQAQKMEAIGTLAGGIAHDFNNILFPLVGFTEMLRDELPKESNLQEYVAEVLGASLRAKDLVGQILAFSRQSKQDRTPIRVQSILKEAIKLTRAGLPSDIRFRMNIQPDCPPIIADATQIHQVIMNLITNAYHAMEENGGELTIELSKISIEPGVGTDPHLPAGPYVCLRVADTGHGIEKAILNRIFEPYFTTKAKGKGTGLGLSVIHGIVTDCHGDIHVESAPGKGTTFTIYFPCLPSHKHPERTDAECEAIPGGQERILLVDDEVAIVFMAKRMLARMGYTVTTRTSSLEALELFRTEPDRFDLVITDLTMPDMTGDRLAKELRTVRPGIPIILFTGFSNRMDENRAAELGIDGFVLKPLLKGDLARAIRKALGDESGTANIN